MYGKGIDRVGEVIDIGVKEDIVSKSGAWFSYGEERLGQGRENAKEFLRENKDILNKIETQIYEKIGITLNKSNSEDSENKDNKTKEDDDLDKQLKAMLDKSEDKKDKEFGSEDLETAKEDNNADNSDESKNEINEDGYEQITLE